MDFIIFDFYTAIELKKLLMAKYQFKEEQIDNLIPNLIRFVIYDNGLIFTSENYSELSNSTQFTKWINIKDDRLFFSLKEDKSNQVIQLEIKDHRFDDDKDRRGDTLLFEFPIGEFNRYYQDIRKNKKLVHQILDKPEIIEFENTIFNSGGIEISRSETPIGNPYMCYSSKYIQMEICVGNTRTESFQSLLNHL